MCQRSKIIPLKVWVRPVTKAPNCQKGIAWLSNSLVLSYLKKEGNIFSAYRGISSTSFPTHFLVHLHFNLVSSRLDLFVSKTATKCYDFIEISK